MKRILNCILLIDDNEADNYLHKMVIEEAGVVRHVVVAESAGIALNYLRSEEEGRHPQPDLIFLDINMPRMNGWEFLEEYQQLDQSQQGKVVVVMLTTSPNPDDKKRAATIPTIDGFGPKPLTPDMLQTILSTYFTG